MMGYWNNGTLECWNDGILEKAAVPMTIKKDNQVAWAPNFE
jgi:hypothetical protein